MYLPFGGKFQWSKLALGNLATNARMVADVGLRFTTCFQGLLIRVGIDAVLFWTLPGKMRSRANYALKAPHKAGRNTLARGAAPRRFMPQHGLSIFDLVFPAPRRFMPGHGLSIFDLVRRPPFYATVSILKFLTTGTRKI